MDSRKLIAVLIYQAFVLSFCTVKADNSYQDEHGPDDSKSTSTPSPIYDDRRGSAPPTSQQPVIYGSHDVIPLAMPTQRPRISALVAQKKLMLALGRVDTRSLCAAATCVRGQQCRVIQACATCVPRAVCVNPTQLPRGADAVCQATRSFSVLLGGVGAGAVRPMRCLPWVRSLARGGCAGGAVCVPSRTGPLGTGTCCTGLPSLTRTSAAVPRLPAAAVPRLPAAASSRLPGRTFPHLPAAAVPRLPAAAAPSRLPLTRSSALNAPRRLPLTPPSLPPFPASPVSNTLPISTGLAPVQSPRFGTRNPLNARIPASIAATKLAARLASLTHSTNSRNPLVPSVPVLKSPSMLPITTSHFVPGKASPSATKRIPQRNGD